MAPCCGRARASPRLPATRSGVDGELSAARSTLLTRSAALEARTPVPVSASMADLPAAPPRLADDYLAQLARSEELFDLATMPVPISHGAARSWTSSTYRARPVADAGPTAH